MKNKLTVTIGIPAYNEEANIAELLKQIQLQKGEDFVVKKIIVVSDASEDKTNLIVKNFRSEKISIIVNKTRKGQIDAQNRIFSEAESDVVVLLEADTIPENEYYLSNLLKPIITNTKIGLVQGNEIPLDSKTFFGKMVSKQFRVFYKFATSNPEINTWLTSGRGGRAFTKNVYKGLRWPHNVPEDTFALLWCKENGYPTFFATSAVCFYKSPENCTDFKQQIIKVKSGKNNLGKYFSKELINKVYQKPFLFNLRCSVHFIWTNPLYFVIYFFAKSFIINTNQRFSDLLPVSKTTKVL